MKVGFFHNSYNVKGGEDSVVSSEIRLLESSGFRVYKYFVNNDDINSLASKVSVGLSCHYSRANKKKVESFLEGGGVDVAHVHNFFPQLTPSIFDAFMEKKVASVLTLHNYRMVCPTALLMFDGKPCERSLNQSAYWAVPHKVYRGSLFGTAILSHMIEYHKKRGTWQSKVDRFICLTDFSKKKFVEAGFPAQKLVVKPNFCEDPGYDIDQSRQANAIFVGRLSEEKGIKVLLDAWARIDFPLKIIGEGDVFTSLPAKVELFGRMSKPSVLSHVKSSQFVVVPSICYEGFPMAIVEAFACGVPVVCSRLGSMEEIVEDGVTGLHFNAGDSGDLADKVAWLIDNPKAARAMGENARQEYLRKYTPYINREALLDIYRQAVEEANKR